MKKTHVPYLILLIRLIVMKDSEDDCRGAVLLDQGRHVLDPAGSHAVHCILFEARPAVLARELVYFPITSNIHKSDGEPSKYPAHMT